MKLKRYLREDLFGRNLKQKQIHDRLPDDKKAEYVKVVKAMHDFYDKVVIAMKSVKIGDYNMSKDEGWRQYLGEVKKALDVAAPNTYTKKHISSLVKDRVSLAGWGSFNFNTEMDKWDYLTAVAMKKAGYTDPDNHKEWLKK
jgi:hypothetical protein